MSSHSGRFVSVVLFSVGTYCAFLFKENLIIIGHIKRTHEIWFNAENPIGAGAATSNHETNQFLSSTNLNGDIIKPSLLCTNREDGKPCRMWLQRKMIRSKPLRLKFNLHNKSLLLMEAEEKKRRTTRFLINMLSMPCG